MGPAEYYSIGMASKRTGRPGLCHWGSSPGHLQTLTRPSSGGHWQGI